MLAGLAIGGAIGYGIAQPAIKKTAIYNEEIAKQNQELERTRSLQQETIRNNSILIQQSEQELYQLEIDKVTCSSEILILEARKQEKTKQLQEIDEYAKEASNIFYEKNMAMAREQLANALEKIRNEYMMGQLEYEQEYETCIKDLVECFQVEMTQTQQAMSILESNLAELQSKVNAAVEVNKRAELERTEREFYRLNLSAEDIEEIEILRSATKNLRNKEPINKVIWKVYYEKPYTDLIGRVVGNKVKTGIYKITNLENGMCYVGQAANIADRWKQHIKRGIGAEPLTRNKLYPAMLAIGVENFTFEIIEECSRNVLNDREDYWQDFYKAKEFGYSIK